MLGLALITLAVLLLICTVIAFRGFSGSHYLSRRTLTVGFLLALVVFSAVNFGAYEVLNGEGQYSAWLGPGYAGGAGGSLLVLILFGLILLKRR